MFDSDMLTATFTNDVEENPRLLCLRATLCSSGCVVGREAIKLGDSIGEGKKTPRMTFAKSPKCINTLSMPSL